LVGQDAETVATLLAARCETNTELDELRTHLRDRLAGSSTFELRTSAPERDLLIELFAVRGDPRPGIGVMLRDMTAERDLARAKDELVAIVSHELRSPLSSIIGFAQLLLLNGNETEAEELHIIIDEGRRLAQLIDDFLDLQRIDRGAIRIEPKGLQLASVIDALAARLPDDPRHPQTAELPVDLPAVWAEHERILQVLINLVTNARKYSPDGGPIHLSATILDDTVKVTVTDTGLGIEADAIPNLFVEFYRVQTPDRQGIAGTGLGLSICKKIIHAHGGEIWAESEGRGLGSLFHFTLPIAALDTNSRARTADSTAHSP
jgi:signal transduction histidine kinase